MSEKRETTSADMRYVILCLTVDIASGGAEETSFLTKIWSFFDLFGKKVALRATFFPKRMSSSALPEANWAGCPGRCLVWNRPRKSYQINRRLGAIAEAPAAAERDKDE